MWGVKRIDAPDYHDRTAVGGGNIRLGETAQNTRQHLARRQWGASPDSPRNNETRRTVVEVVQEGRFKIDPPTHGEVARAKAELARGKSVGVGEVQAELLQLLADGGRTHVPRNGTRGHA